MEALLFRTGYLMIAGGEVRNGSPRYRLDYPNLGARRSLGGVLLEGLLPEASRREAEDLPLRERMAANDLAGVGEDGGSRSRADMALRFNRQVHLFEFKVVDRGPEGTALAQLRAKGYADKYRDPGLPVRLIGVEFGREERNIVAFPVEMARTAGYPAHPSSATTARIR